MRRRRIPARDSKRRKRTAFVFIIGLTAAFLCGEIFLDVTSNGYGNAPLNSNPVLHHVHPRNRSTRRNGVGGPKPVPWTSLIYCPLFRAAQVPGEPPFLERDGDFNELGHALVAEAVRRKYPDVFGETPAAVITVDRRRTVL